MTEKMISAGELVSAAYKTGVYIGEIIELIPHRAIVKVLAVQKHPTQGDLHNPNQANVAMFHERRALAFQEKAVIPLSALTSYSGSVPAYSDSLKQAINTEIETLMSRAESDEWVQKSLHLLYSLKQDYFPSNE